MNRLQHIAEELWGFGTWLLIATGLTAVVGLLIGVAVGVGRWVVVWIAGG